MLRAWWHRIRRRPRAAADAVRDGALRAATRRPVDALDLLDLSERPRPDLDLAWRRTIRNRVGAIVVVLGCWAAGLEARLVYLQVLSHEHYATRAERQQQRVLHPVANRGDIVDRHGNLLAYSVDANTIVADPRSIADPAATAAQICRALGDCAPGEQQRLVERFSAGREFAYVRRTLAVSPEQVERVLALGLTGVTTLTESRRYYPNLGLAAHVLGFVGQEHTGLGGIEAAFDTDIRGREGVVLVLADGGQQHFSARVEQAPTAGATLELTIDRNLQHIVERELRAGVIANRARGGTVVVMDPYTGGILALANYPTFNPNTYGQSSADARRNRAIQDVYEPGSTFKIVTASAAIEEGVVSPSDIIDTSPGWIKLAGRPPIHDVGSYSGPMTFEDVIVRSSNVGAIKVGLRTGADRISRYVRRFGFGQALARDLPGQSRGVVYPPTQLDESGLASVSMGYQISVTAVQMATAASAVANGGLLMEPHVVRAIVREGERHVIAPKELRRPITPETARTLRTLMEGVVERGSGQRAKLAGYQVAGKTGTANRIVDGRYSKTDQNVSFVGFVPSRRPAFTILVLIDTPRAASNYGGSVSAPIFKNIAEAALRQWGVPPSRQRTPPLVISALAGLPIIQRTRAAAVPTAAAPADDRALMPDLRGLGARDAVRMLGALGMSVRVTGSGLVASQVPEAGAPIEPGDVGRLQLSRRPVAPRAGGGGP